MAEEAEKFESDSEQDEVEDFDYQPPVIASYDVSLSRSRLHNTFNLQQLPVLLISLATFSNGLVGLVEPLFQRLSKHPRIFDMVVPYGIYHWSRSLSLVFGFMLVYLSFNLLARKKVSYLLALAALCISLLVHLLRARMEYGRDDDFVSESIGFAVLPIVLNIALLIIYRKRFSVKSEIRKIKTGVTFLAYSLLVALAYGTLGFWLLDKRDFGINFQVTDSILRTLRELLLIGNADLHAETRHAAWFLDSLRLAGSLSAVFACYSLFRPIEYQLRTRPVEREMAAKILDRYAHDALDNYKLLSDKSYLFSASGNCLVAYKTCLGVAICLGDVVGPEEELAEFLKAFVAWSHENGWNVAFMQCSDRYLELYKNNSLSVLKIGEDGIVDLDKFTSSTGKKKNFKSSVKKFEKDGFTFHLMKPPHSAELLAELEEVSNEWLSLPGRRERCFSLGIFDKEELQHDNIFAVKSKDGKIIAFVNQVRSYAPQEVSIDLMRHRNEVPNGTMDFLFVKLLFALHEAGFKRFSLGLAALSGVGESPDANLYEKAVHQIYEHMNRFFSYKGLRNYKNKFEPSWESRYLIYEGATPGLLKTTLAILDASEP
ncbi:MAG: phosphatidylglycerol lysyltransferase domain-containing protein [Candidatus Obscuribacterales bacterium]|nr:phosphatidylglycerol lysyltransferase domain-containing protein [Candidatus Obscuribacterales bacterium]